VQQQRNPAVLPQLQVLDVLASSAPLIAPPGARPSYSNLGLALLGHFLAEWVYEDGPGRGGLAGLVAKYVTGPLGMRDTGYNYTEEGVCHMLVPGHTEDAWHVLLLTTKPKYSR
jgi:CubicO group peptidase (beta-lactamase class C family)